MSFRVLGIDPDQFSHLYELPDADLAAAGAKRYIVDAKPGFPDRIEVRDMEIGECAILLNYEHQPAERRIGRGTLSSFARVRRLCWT